MFREYAKVPKMRLNLGIRRRLAPLVDNDRSILELLHALIMSVPGSPIFYYGDEINMGDNIYLGDRNGVRTPMQWSFDRNAGFSHADSEQLYSPVITNPNYHYESNNVESMPRLSTSFLNWFRRMIIVRKQNSRVLGRGTIRFIGSDQKQILAFIREYGKEKMLCVYNLSRSPSYVELHLPEFNGWHLREAISSVRFPDIGELPYFFTLPRHSYFWLIMEAPDENS